MKRESAQNPFPARLATAFAVASAFLLAPPVSAANPPAGQKTFGTPEQAAEALVAAAEKDDVAALLEILGPDGKDLVSSADAVQDKNERTNFVRQAREKMQVSEDPINPGWMFLSVGAEDWPLPIPIVQKSGKWRFDFKQGRGEILAQRIGENELDAIALLRGYVEAQTEYAEEEHDDSGMLQYAQKAISTPGKQDGLCWSNADGSVGGPIGDLVAQALAAGYKSKTEPYNGYFFRILTAQGPAAPKGALDYVVNGRMIGGFGMVAWPAQYGVTGIQTFMVNHDGIVYQKDLGPETSKVAAGITRYNPDKSWLATEDEE
ncbi:MAG: DUF2950 domain-containing protein [Thermoanaerobaculia bacterium]